MIPRISPVMMSFMKCHPDEVKSVDIRNGWIKHEAWWNLWSHLIVTCDFMPDKSSHVLACLFWCAYCIMVGYKSINIYWWKVQCLLSCLIPRHCVNSFWFVMKIIHFQWQLLSNSQYFLLKKFFLNFLSLLILLFESNSWYFLLKEIDSKFLSLLILSWH